MRGGTFVAARPPRAEENGKPLGDNAWAVLDYRVAIETGATVRWSTDDSVGVQFDGLRAKDVWALGKYLEQLSP